MDFNRPTHRIVTMATATAVIATALGCSSDSTGASPNCTTGREAGSDGSLPGRADESADVTRPPIDGQSNDSGSARPPIDGQSNDDCSYPAIDVALESTPICASDVQSSSDVAGTTPSGSLTTAVAWAAHEGGTCWNEGLNLRLSPAGDHVGEQPAGVQIWVRTIPPVCGRWVVTVDILREGDGGSTLWLWTGNANIDLEAVWPRLRGYLTVRDGDAGVALEGRFSAPSCAQMITQCP